MSTIYPGLCLKSNCQIWVTLTFRQGCWGYQTFGQISNDISYKTYLFHCKGQTVQLGYGLNICPWFVVYSATQSLTNPCFSLRPSQLPLSYIKCWHIMMCLCAVTNLLNLFLELGNWSMTTCYWNSLKEQLFVQTSVSGTWRGFSK